MFLAVVVGVVLGQVASRITQYYTSSEFKPVRDIADSGRTGPATVVLSGISSRHGVGGLGRRRRRRRHPRRRSASAAATRCSPSTWSPSSASACCRPPRIVVAEDTFGPIADNAQGIAEMSGEFHGETETILDGLDTVGNTTKAVTKGFAIGSAVIAAVALFASFRETIAAEARRDLRRDRHQHRRSEDLRRRARRRHRRLPVLVAGHPRGRAARPERSSRRSAGSSGRSPGSWTTPRSPTTAR